MNNRLRTISQEKTIHMEKDVENHEKLITELSVLNEIGQMLCRNLELDDLLKAIGAQISRIFDTTNFEISLYTEGSDEWVLAYAILDGKKDQDMGRRFNIKSGLNGYIIQNRVPILFHTKKERDTFFKIQGLDSIGMPSRSWLGVPLISAGKILGAMSIQDHEKENIYTEQDMLLFSTIASQAASTIERKRVEESLKESIAQYRYLFDSMPNGYYLSTHDGYYVDANPAFIRMLGYDSLDDLKTVHIPTHIYVSESERKGLCENSEFTDQTEIYRHKRKDGQIIWIEDNARYIRDSNGTVLFHQGVCKDITDRKRAEEINSVLFEISNAVNTTEDLEDLYASIHKSLGRIIDLTNFHISLYDRKQDVLTFVYWVDTVDQPPKNFQVNNVTSPKTASHTAEIIVTGKPVLHSGEQFKEILHQRGVHPVFSISAIWLGVPLKIKEEVIGAMVAHSFSNPTLYTEKDVDILMSVSNQVAIAIDQKRTESALKESLERFRVLIEQAPEAIVVYDVGPDRFVDANTSAQRLFGCSRNELLQSDLQRFYPSRQPDQQSPNESFSRFCNHSLTGETIKFECLVHSADGRNRLCEAHLVRLPSEQGRLIRASFIDLTERKQAEEALRESEKKFRQIYDNILDVYYEASLKGIILEISPSIEKNSQYKREELIGRSMYDIYPDLSNKDTFLDEIVNKGAAKDYEAVFQDKDGSGRVCSLNIELIKDLKGHPEKIVGIFRDISDRKKNEAERIEAQKIAGEQEKLVLVGRIAGKMAHDFNNILGAIMGNSELALLDCTDPETRKTLELIFEQTIRGKNLTKNLVAFAKDQEPKQEFFKIDEKMDLVISLLKKDLEGIRVIRDYNPNLPELLADPGMIEHALVNLIQNSIHATSLSKQPQIILRTNHQEGRIVIEIEDNGCGIPKEFLEEIFEPSFTLKGSKDKNGMYSPGIKGTGYGMSNVKRYIEQHMGRISIHSEVHKGTKITLDLPVTGKELTQEEIMIAQKETILFGKYILLVEDEPTISNIQYRILSHKPCYHKVDIANNGQIAIDLLDRNRYDLVSLDYILPGKFNGMDVYHHIRKTNKTVPVLFISGNIDFLESINDLKQNDPNIEHLSKPCKNIDYISCINKLFGKAAM